MKIVAIEVVGFGALRERSLTLGAGLTLLYGPNEAGKSTLMSFIRAVLFGFPPRSNKAERYEPAGGVHGGSLLLVDEEGRRFRVERYDGSAASGAGSVRRPSAGTVKVTLDDGATGGEELLQRLLGGLSAELFRSLFAFGLSELQELRSLQAEELSGYIYSAGLGVSGTAIREAERKLAVQTDSLYKPRGRNQQIAEQLRELEETEKLLRQSRAQSASYNALKAERHDVQRRIDECRQQQRSLQAQLDKLELAARARSTWVRFKGVNRELAELPELPGFPDEALVRLVQLEDELERAEAACAALELRQRDLLERLARYAPVAGAGERSEQVTDRGGAGDELAVAAGPVHAARSGDRDEAAIVRVSGLHGEDRGEPASDAERTEDVATSAAYVEAEAQGEFAAGAVCAVDVATSAAYGEAEAQGEFAADAARTVDVATSGTYGEAEAQGEFAADAARTVDVAMSGTYGEAETQREFAADAARTEDVATSSAYGEAETQGEPAAKTVRTGQPSAERERLLNELLDGAQVYEEKRRELLETQAELAQQRLMTARLLEQIDARWTEETLAAFPVSIALREEIRAFKERFAGLHEEEQRLLAEREQVRLQSVRLDDSLQLLELELARLTADAPAEVRGRETGRAGAADGSDVSAWTSRKDAEAGRGSMPARGLGEDQGYGALLATPSSDGQEGRAASRFAGGGEGAGRGAQTASGGADALERALQSAEAAGQRADEAAALVRQLAREHARWRLLSKDAEHARERAAERLQQQALWAEAEALGRKTAASRRIRLALIAALAGLTLAAWLLWQGAPLAAAAVFVVMIGMAIILGTPGAGRSRRAQSQGVRPVRTPEAAPGSRAGRQAAARAAGAPFIASPAWGEAGAAAPEREAAAADRLEAQLAELERSLQTKLERLLGGRAEAAAALGGAAFEHAPAAGRSATTAAALGELDSLLERLQLEVEHGRERRSELRAKRDKLKEAQAAREALGRQEAQQEAASRRFVQAAAEQTAAWQAWLGERLLSPSLSPDAALETAQAAERAQEQLRQQRRLEDRRERLLGDVRRYEASAAAELGEAARQEPVTALRRWKERQQEEQRRREEERQLRERLAELEQERRLAADSALRVSKRLDSLLREASAENGEQLRLLHRRQEQRSKLLEERKLLAEALEALVGAAALPALTELLDSSGEDELEGRRRELEQQLQRSSAEEGSLREQAGKLLGEVEKLEQGQELADRLLQGEAQRAALGQLIGQYAVSALASLLIRKARDVYERERQPGVLQRASGYFAAMTEGGFAQVKAPLGEQRLVAVRAGGEAVDTALLSRGTAEQLYLAMRLALAEEYAGKAVLPLVLDDILVNFDDRRMASCLRVLIDFSARHQVLLFTCHAHVRDAVRKLGPEQNVIELPAG